MNFDDFLEKYQRFVQKKIASPECTLQEEEIKTFLKYLEIAIEAYNDNANDSRAQYHKWEHKTKRLCYLRTEVNRLLVKDKNDT